MKKTNFIKVLALLASTSCMVACSDDDSKKDTKEEEPVYKENVGKNLKDWTFIEKTATAINLSLTKDEEKIMKQQIADANNIYKHLAESNKNKNICFSPTSLQIALAMLMQGADNQASNEIAKTIGFNSDYNKEEVNRYYNKIIRSLNSTIDTSFSISTNNAVWLQYDEFFKVNFLKSVQDNYFATTCNLDFQKNPEEAKSTIDSWADAMTNGCIKELSLSINPFTKMVLNNATYFKANWDDPFLQEFTDDFTNINGQKESAEMMYKQSYKNEYSENDQFQAINLNYGEGKYCMTIVLPREGVSLNSVEKDIDWNNLNMKKLEKYIYQIRIPKFKIKTSVDLVDEMKKLDVESIFKTGHLENIFEKGYVSQIVQDAYINVDKKGTEAAAVTSIVVDKFTSGDIDVTNVVFNADRPFLYAIREKGTGLILFMGRVCTTAE